MIPAGAQSNDGLCGSVWVCTTLYTVFFLEAQSQPDPVSFPVASKAHAPFSWIKDPCEFSKKTGYLLSIVLAPHSDTPSVFQRWWVWFLYLVFFFPFLLQGMLLTCVTLCMTEETKVKLRDSRNLAKDGNSKVRTERRLSVS